jgi:hypothetical protein
VCISETVAGCCDMLKGRDTASGEQNEMGILREDVDQAFHDPDAYFVDIVPNT